MAAQGRGARSLEKDSCLGSEYINLNQIARRTTMTKDLTLPKDAASRNDSEPPNFIDLPEDLTMPDGRPAAFRVKCNVSGAMSLSVPAAEASFTVLQRIGRRGEEQLVDSVQVLCGEQDNGTITVRVLVWTPKGLEPLQVALLTSRPEGAATGNDLIECDLGNK